MTSASEPFATHLDDDQIVEHMPSITRLSRDLAMAARTMGPKEARYLVDAYYISQENRKRAANQARSMTGNTKKPNGDATIAVDSDGNAILPEPHILIDWLHEQARIGEGQIKRALDQYTQGHIMGSWMRQIVGIGPVISAGILAHLETPRPSAGIIYSFAGIAGRDQKAWGKGEKRPYNVRLKTLCWHAGQSFMKLSARDDCFYGKIYRQRKEFEQHMSESGQRSETAKEWLTKVGKTTQAYGHYSSGKLPPSQIDARARRFAVKMFLSHMNEVWMIRLGQTPPAPYALAHLRHVDYIPPPIPA